MRPEKPPVFDPQQKRFWDAEDLEKELRRVFQVCHGCRMCVGFCPSFPDLFSRIDGYEEQGRGEVDALTDEDFASVNEHCFQCKLCYFKCPYTPDDDHDFQIDFPRLMLRHKAHRAERDGVSLQDQVLGEPQLLGKFASGHAATASNLVSKSSLLRKVQEKALGISAEFNLPPFAEKSFRSWFKKKQKKSSQLKTEKNVVLFSTCTVDWNLPNAGKSAVEVLEHNGFNVHFPEAQTCCGMPNLDGGDVDAAFDKAQKNIETLLPFAEKGFPIVVPGPTCSYVLKKEYPEMVKEKVEAQKVADHTFDLMEFLRKLMREKELNRDFKQPLGNVAYQTPCHLRAQKVGFPAQQILSKVPETEVRRVEQCSAVDGTWGMKSQFFDLGKKYAQKLTREMNEERFDVIATDCPLSGQRLEQELGVKAHHPIELLHQAYDLKKDGE